MSYQSFYPSYADTGLFSRAEIVLPTTDTGYKSYGPNGRLFLPAATNLIGNPRISSPTFLSMNVGAWVGGAPSLTTTSLGARLVATATAESYLDMSHSNTSSDYDIARWGVEVGDVVTYTVDVDMQYAGFASMVTCIVFFTAGWASIAEPHTHIENGKSTVSVTATIPATTAYLVPYPLRMTGPAESTVDATVTKAMLTKASYASPYFDGDSDNCAWTGAANASTSTRAASALNSYPTSTSLPGGTLAGGISLVTPGNDGVVHYIFGAFLGAQASAIYKNTDGKVYGVVSNGNWNITGGVDAGAWTANSVHTAVFRWSGSTTDLSVDGVAATSGVIIGAAVQNTSAIFPPIGQAIASTSEYTGKSLLYSPVVKSDAWTSAVQNYLNDPAKLWRDFMEPGDMLIPLTSDSRAYVKTNGAMGSAYANTFTGADPTTDTGWVSYE